MQSNSYKELIEEKIEEWKNRLVQLEERVKHEGPKTIEEAKKMLVHLDKAVDSAAVKLRDLDKKENASNTMMIKKNILQIFDSIDKDLVVYEDKTPFML